MKKMTLQSLFTLTLSIAIPKMWSSKTILLPISLELMFVSHLLLFANHDSPNNTTFSIDNIPRDCAWGTRKVLPTHLCAPNTNKPITVWVLGEIVEASFDHLNESHSSVGITVEPVTQGTTFTFKALLGRLQCPPVGKIIRLLSLHDTYWPQCMMAIGQTLKLHVF